MPGTGSVTTYLSNPIDWNWGLLTRLDRVWSANREMNDLPMVEPWAAFHLGAFLQVVMNHGYAVASDHREPPRIIALPEANGDGFITHGFIWNRHQRRFLHRPQATVSRSVDEPS